MRSTATALRRSGDTGLAGGGVAVETAGYRQAADVAAAPAVAVSRGLSRNAIACGYLRNLGLNSVNIVL